MAATVVFVGGPRAGQKMMVETALPTIHVPLLVGSSMGFSSFAYERQEFRDGGSRTHYLYFPAGTPQGSLLDVLLEDYVEAKADQRELETMRR